MGLTQAQNIMLTQLEVYCVQHETGAWIGNDLDLEAIGGKALLYELEQAGVVSINRIREKWIVCPDRGAEVNSTDESLPKPLSSYELGKSHGYVEWLNNHYLSDPQVLDSAKNAIAYNKRMGTPVQNESDFIRGFIEGYREAMLSNSTFL